MTSDDDRIDDDDIEDSTVHERYEFDCPYCGGVTDLRDVQPDTGELVDCDDCGQPVRMAS